MKLSMLAGDSAVALPRSRASRLMIFNSTMAFLTDRAAPYEIPGTAVHAEVVILMSEILGLLGKVQLGYGE